MQNLLNNQIVKISNKSITVKDENNKTKNVITGIESFYSMPFNRQMDWNMKFHKYGKMPLDRMFLHNDKWYLLIDQNYMPTALTDSEYIRNKQKLAEEKLNNAINFKVIIINVLQLFDGRNK